jgi:hypothetical protein
MRLLKVVSSTRPEKKWMAVFETTPSGRTKTVHFGSAGMDDYTITRDKEQRERYRRRHQKDLTTADPTRAGYLSYYLLWGNTSSLRQNVENYKRRFNL